MKEILQNLIYTLGCIEVRGKQNLDRLLGCIMTLEKLRDMVKTEQREIEPEEEKHADTDQQGEQL